MKGIHFTTFCCHSNHDVALVAKLFYNTERDDFGIYFILLVNLHFSPPSCTVASGTNSYNRVTFSGQQPSAAARRRSESAISCESESSSAPQSLHSVVFPPPLIIHSILRHPAQLLAEEHVYFPQQCASTKAAVYLCKRDKDKRGLRNNKVNSTDQ